ncbi:MAG TPA: sugar phosphate nucleotidyltransferase [Symbiobacteriaceae bacterium]|jgi:mannose-1-phosphate guanylyltransferase|nr:sugar phosphate nucleotidyltransferase [Symbiobacteriaceae bacterium]
MPTRKPPETCVAIMAGGRGLRLWPRSNARAPKQLQGFFGGPVLLRQTLAAASALTPADRTYVVTAADLLERTQVLLDPGVQILAEPWGRDTAACAALAALHVERSHPGAILILLPADHWVGDVKAFAATLAHAATLAARHNCLVTVGVQPTRPETGFGYILAEPGHDGVHRGVRFREKPTAQEAARLIAEGNVFWNAGIFVASAATLLALIRQHLPATNAGLERIAEALGTPSEAAVLADVYATLPAVSLDRGVAERLDHFLVVPAAFPWDDVGSWTAFPRIIPPDPNGNLTSGPVHTADATRCLVDTPALKTTLLGVHDLIIVQDGDRLLVAAADRAQDIKQVAAAQEANTASEAQSGGGIP